MCDGVRHDQDFQIKTFLVNSHERFLYLCFCLWSSHWFKESEPESGGRRGVVVVVVLLLPERRYGQSHLIKPHPHSPVAVCHLPA